MRAVRRRLAQAETAVSLQRAIILFGHGPGALQGHLILPLYKTQVRALATYLGVPQPVIDRPPRPDLIPGITDELALGVTYEVLDLILVGLASRADRASIALEAGVAPALVAKIENLISLAQALKHDPPYPLLQG